MSRVLILASGLTSCFFAILLVEVMFDMILGLICFNRPRDATWEERF